MKKKKKFENNWRHKSLENLEKHIWPAPDPDEGSYLILTCNKLRKQQLKDFSIEDLRIMIGQEIGLRFLIPLAIEQLHENILVEGDLYEGDLLKNVLVSDPEYWQSEKDNWQTICDLFNANKQRIRNFDTTSSIKAEIFTAFEKFEKLH
ncbi:MAG: contact-dependent growth inhibition system immunity protein [Bacteroidota bacterium]